MTPTLPRAKGTLLGPCNRSACASPVATFYNHGTESFYCRGCALEINGMNPEAVGLFGHELCMPYQPKHLAWHLQPLPPLTHAPATLLEFIQVEDFQGASQHYQSLNQVGRDFELAAAAAMPFPHTHQVSPVWVPDAACVAQGRTEQQCGYRWRGGRVKEAFTDLSLSFAPALRLLLKQYR